MCSVISRAAAIEAIQEIEQMYEREEDMDCAEAVMSARWAVQDLKPVEAVSIEKLKAVAGIALELVGLYENAECELLWMENGEDMAQAKESERELHNTCHEYRRRIKLLAGLKGADDGNY